MIMFVATNLFSKVQSEMWEGFFCNAPTCVNLIPVANDGHEGKPKDHHAPALLPELAYEGTTFVLAVPYAIEDATIVIRDTDGNIVYYDTVASISDYYMFQLDDEILDEIAIFELYYSDRHLWGEF